jgi:tRNA(Ile)-lysidine synthase
MFQPDRVERAFVEAWPPRVWSDVTVLLAVSGGTDSMALLRAALAVAEEGPGRVVVAHYNHALRGEQSDADEALVRETCRQRDVACDCERASPLEESAAGAAEAPLRQARYEFFRRAADRYGARYMATAHTADDQAETVLHRILRGTGLRGLRGIRPVRRFTEGCTLVRPLLGVRRSDIAAYLALLGQPHREDASNRDPRRTRNRIRHDLLPRLAGEFNPSIVDALVRLSDQAAGAIDVIGQQAGELKEHAIVEQSPGRVEIDCLAAGSQTPYLVAELLRRVWHEQQWPLRNMGQSKWRMLAQMVLAPAGADVQEQRVIDLPGRVVATRRGPQLVLTGPMGSRESRVES